MWLTPEEMGQLEENNFILQNLKICYKTSIMKRTYQPSNLVRKRRHGFRSRMSTPGGKKVLIRRRQKGRKSSLPNRSNRLKKREEFLDLRNNCVTLHGRTVIINIRKNSRKKTFYGITVSKKAGNAVTRNYLKRIFRSIIYNNWKILDNAINFEVIPKNILKNSFSDIEKDFIKALTSKKI